MTTTSLTQPDRTFAGLGSWLAGEDARGEQFATEFVAHLLAAAAAEEASDVHIEPAHDSVQLRVRVDGVLAPLDTVPREVGPNIVARLKVLAGLLTYETAVPQEGRIRQPAQGREFRVSTFPAIFGEKVVVRVLGSGGAELEQLADLGLPDGVRDVLAKSLRGTSGGIIVAGPAGSGKTTTAYACLREIAAIADGGRSIASLEDPVEVVVPGAVQSQVNSAAGFDMATGLRSLLRQDPEVILIGEIRDRTTAEIALQAALTGQLVITTFHAGSCAEVVHRLVDMGLPSYAIRNAVRLVVTQRLLRRLCTCRVSADAARDARPLGFQVDACWLAGGCDGCRQTGYRGRVLIAEALSVDSPAVHAALADATTSAGLSALAPVADGNLWSAAEALIQTGVTCPLEAMRVLGWKSAE